MSKPFKPTFMGMNIVESALLTPEPKIKLSASCPVGPKFRAEMDSWLLNRFGRKPAQVLIIGGALHVPPGFTNMLRREGIHV